MNDRDNERSETEPALELVSSMSAKRRVIPAEPPTLGSTVTLREVVDAVRDIAIAAQHNTKAMLEELDDIRAKARLDSKAMLDAVAILLSEVRLVQDRLDKFEKRLPPESTP